MNTNVAAWWYGDGSHTPCQVQALFEACEQSLSRFGDSAELVQLNRSEGTVCPVSARLFSALEAALWAAQFTQGLYDPTLLDALEEAGYDRSFETIITRWDRDARSDDENLTPATAAVLSDLAPLPGTAARRACEWLHVQLLPDRQAIRRPRGLRFDLGGMGKGWTVDRSADMLHGQGPYLINAGGDLYAAGKPDGAHGWTVYVEHPWHPQSWIAQLHLEDAALATSTVTKRRWGQGDSIQHHLIDPRSGRPAQTDVLAVSVIAKRTMIAEVVAKAALLLGAEDGLAYLARTADVDGLVVRSDGRLLYTAGFERRLLAIDEQGCCRQAA